MSLGEFGGRRQIATPDEMESFGERIGGMLRAGDLVVLTGPLGAGKTTLTRGIAAGVGVRGPVQSPTFVIARTHPSLIGGAPLVHVDAYRLGSALELDDLDLDLDGSVVIVEWGRGMIEGLRDHWWEIELERPVGGGGAFGGGGAGGGAVGVVDGAGGGESDLDADAARTLTLSRRPS